MMEKLLNCIGCIPKRMVSTYLLCQENEDIKFIRLYIFFNTWLSIVCSEETLFIKNAEPVAIIDTFNGLWYENKEIDISFIKDKKLLKISILSESISSVKIIRGILFVFEDGQNFCLYNKGYEIEDKQVFKINFDIKVLPYKEIDIKALYDM